MKMSAKIYHERQVKELCAIHALNNLFQRKLFTKSVLDHICECLSPSRWFNPHRSFLGTGNFDINVILSALDAKGYAGIWFDKRKDPKTLNLEKIIGFIINAPSPYEFGVIRFPLSRRHWYAICQVNGQYYNLDSKLTAPVPIGDNERVITYLQTELKTNDRELFIVVEQEVEKEASWTASNHQESIGKTKTQEVQNYPIGSMVEQELNEPVESVANQEVLNELLGKYENQVVQSDPICSILSQELNEPLGKIENREEQNEPIGTEVNQELSESIGSVANQLLNEPSEEFKNREEQNEPLGKIENQDVQNDPLAPTVNQERDEPFRSQEVLNDPLGKSENEDVQNPTGTVSEQEVLNETFGSKNTEESDQT